MERGTFVLTEADEALLPRLPDHHQRILSSTGTYRERAAALDIPLGIVRSRLSRARAALNGLRAQATGEMGTVFG